MYEYRLGHGAPAHIESLDSYNDDHWHTVHLRRFYWNGVLEIDNLMGKCKNFLYIELFVVYTLGVYIWYLFYGVLPK